jgi:hypothetical protein
LLYQIVNANEFLSADEWSPLIVIGNRKSGSKDTSAILANFRTQLNPAQVRSENKRTKNPELHCRLNIFSMNSVTKGFYGEVWF